MKGLTSEVIMSMSWKKVSDYVVLEACAIKWREWAVKDLGGGHDCPACLKWGHYRCFQDGRILTGDTTWCGGDKCPLFTEGDGFCCGGTHAKFIKKRNRTNADKVAEFIEGVMEDMGKEQKYKWVNVTKDCKFANFLFHNGSIRGICIHIASTLLNVYFEGSPPSSLSTDYRVIIDPCCYSKDYSFKIEHRMSGKPDTVDITVEGKTVTISRLSDPVAFAVVRGLVK